MKKYIYLFSALFILGCSDDNNINNCNLLFDVGVNANISLNSGPLSILNTTGNVAKLEGFGNGGIILIRVNSETIRAWDGADPNHAFASCSILEITGVNAKCGCEDGNEYNLFTGQSIGDNPQPCTLLAYRVDAVGNNQFIISNF